MVSKVVVKDESAAVEQADENNEVAQTDENNIVDGKVEGKSPGSQDQDDLSSKEGIKSNASDIITSDKKSTSDFRKEEIRKVLIEILSESVVQSEKHALAFATSWRIVCQIATEYLECMCVRNVMVIGPLDRDQVASTSAVEYKTVLLPSTRQRGHHSEISLFDEVEQCVMILDYFVHI